MKVNGKKFGKLNAREKWMYVLATIGFFIGWGLTIWGFVTEPVGEVHTSVQWILGQSLVYSASTFGIGMYFKKEQSELKNDLSDYIDTRLLTFKNGDNEAETTEDSKEG